MGKSIFLILFSIFTLLQSCTSTVQTRYNFKKPNPQPENINSDESNQTKLVIDQKQPEEIQQVPKSEMYNTSYDTIKIDLKKFENFPFEISRGKELLFNKEYKSALQTFLSYINRSNSNDFYFWLAKFYIAECLYGLNQKEQSIEELVELLQNNDLPKEIKEKIYTKLVYIHCENNRPQEAKFYIELLKKEYPNLSTLPECN